MKKILLSIFSLAVVLSVNLNAQSQRLVFVEEFTQASCPPCETTTPELNMTLEANEGKVVQLRYQTSWPGVDPMNADNPAEVATRVSYYGVTGVPTLFMNGAEPTGVSFPTLISQANIDNEYAKPSPVKIEISHLLSSDLTSVDVTLNVINEGTETYAAVATNRLRVALVEEVISWSTPPGSTSILDYEYVMKTFITGTDGIEVPEVLAGETWTQTWTVDVPNTIYNFNEFAVVGFIQDDANKSIVNAGISHAYLLADYPDLAATAGGTGSSDFCDFAYTPSLTVENAGGGEATGFTASVNVNGTAVETVEVTDALAAGASTDVTFAELQLSPGANLISYSVQSSNGDVASNNNQTSPVSFAKASDGQPSVEVGFEGETVGEFPSNGAVASAFADNPLNFRVFDADAFGLTTPIGGFGESDQAMMINFWQWNPANVDANGTFAVLDRWLVPTDVDSALVTFDYAYTSWDGSSDRLIVEISADCGATYTELFNKAGSELLTTPELNLNNQYLIPAADDWAAVELDVTQWAGETVLIRMAVVSAWGDQLWIDNINTETRMVSSNENLVDVSGLEIFPNPASNYTNVSFELAEAKTVTLSVVDNLGRVVASQDFGTLAGSQNLSLDLSGLAKGVYMIQGNFGDELSINKISITE